MATSTETSIPVRPNVRRGPDQASGRPGVQASVSTPGGSPAGSGAPDEEISRKTDAPSVPSASAAAHSRPHRPGRNRPVGKIISRTATVTGRNDPKRLRNHSAASTPARARSGLTP